MTPAELHAWVVAQWQAKLDVARAATPGPWQWVDPGGRVKLALVADGHPWQMVLPSATPDVYPQVGDADHIAAFDPAFAIAVCEAALRRLERHSAMPSGLCYAHFDDDTKWLDCLIALDDAAPFAGQPDFPEELKRP